MSLSDDGLSMLCRQNIALREENASLRLHIELRRGDTASLSNEVEMWRERALEAEEELARLRAQPQTVRGPGGPLQCLRCGTVDAFGPASKREMWAFP